MAPPPSSCGKLDETLVMIDTSQSILQSLEEELDNLRRKYQTETESYEQQLGTLRRQHTSLQDINGDLERNLLASRSALSQITTDVSTLQCRYDAMKVITR